jgi:hypothetical protein
MRNRKSEIFVKRKTILGKGGTLLFTPASFLFRKEGNLKI